MVYTAFKERLKSLFWQLTGYNRRKVYRLRSGREYYSGMWVGEMWEKIGRLQYRFMLRQGLKPEHKFLDVGCGSLRGGVHFIRYLNPGNYYGMDANRILLDAAREIELPRYGLADRPVSLVCRKDFDFSVFGVPFDYALAQSVFTHLPRAEILKCLLNIRKVLKTDGRFYATYFEETTGVKTHPDRDPYHYDFKTVSELAGESDLKVERLGDWGHPRRQKMLAFTREGH